MLRAAQERSYAAIAACLVARRPDAEYDPFVIPYVEVAMQRARAAIALLAVLAIDAPAEKFGNALVLDGATAQRPDVRSLMPVATRDGLTRVSVTRVAASIAR